MSASSSASLFVDDLHSVAISRLVAEKKIDRDDARARIHLDGVTGEFLSPGLISPTGAGGYSFTAIAGSAAGGCGFTTTVSVVGIACCSVGFGIGARAILDRG